MLNAALGDGMAYRKSVFELFARSLPKDREYGIIAGIDRAIEGILNFGFNIEQIEWLIAEGIFILGIKINVGVCICNIGKTLLFDAILEFNPVRAC